MKRFNTYAFVKFYSALFNKNIGNPSKKNFTAHILCHERRILNLYSPKDVRAIPTVFNTGTYFMFQGDPGTEALFCYLEGGERLVIPYAPGELRQAMKAAYHFARLNEQFVCLDMPDDHVCWENFNHNSGMVDICISWSALLDLAVDYWRP